MRFAISSAVILRTSPLASLTLRVELAPLSFVKSSLSVAHFSLYSAGALLTSTLGFAPVFGCGGNRDRLKRPIMAQVAQKFADRVVVTSDNSRDENVNDIFKDIKAGFISIDEVSFEVDRANAIAKTVSTATSNDVVLIAGKGHELYQELMGKRHYFSDKEQALSALNRWGQP